MRNINEKINTNLATLGEIIKYIVKKRIEGNICFGTRYQINDIIYSDITDVLYDLKRFYNNETH